LHVNDKNSFTLYFSCTIETRTINSKTLHQAAPFSAKNSIFFQSRGLAKLHPYWGHSSPLDLSHPVTLIRRPHSSGECNMQHWGEPPRPLAIHTWLTMPLRVDYRHQHKLITRARYTRRSACSTTNVRQPFDLGLSVMSQ